MKKMALFLLLPMLLAQALVAQEEEADLGIESSPGVFLQVTSSPAAKIGFNWRFRIPFLQGDGPLTRGNNITVTPGLEISPVDVHLTASAVWTPIAFVEIVAGGRIGSGWNINLFGDDIHGMGLNLAEEDADGYMRARHDGGALDGLLWQARAGAAIQGDLAAFFPGEWNHVIFRSFHEISHAAYSRATGGEFWFFENDAGENRNAFSYRGNLLIGYQMPIFLSMVALIAEAERFLQGPPDREQWGDHRLRWTFSGVLNFSVTERFEIALITQFRTRRNFLEPGWEYMHVTGRTLDTANPLCLEFHRVVVAFTHRF
ncbi:MAG: hypothetical protein FWB79_02740 [Treponema sp.]|nr:hypothetical protein [Treponema sp.]